MKTVMIVILGMMSANSMAIQIKKSDLLLSKSSNAGFVAPAFRHSTVCSVYANQVTVESYGPTVDFPYTVKQNLRFNAEIPNLEVLQNLVSEMNGRTRMKGPSTVPVDAGSTVYSVYPQGGKTVSLKHVVGPVVQMNTARMTEKLLNFLELNCAVRAIEPRPNF